MEAATGCLLLQTYQQPPPPCSIFIPSLSNSTGITFFSYSHHYYLNKKITTTTATRSRRWDSSNAENARTPRINFDFRTEDDDDDDDDDYDFPPGINEASAGLLDQITDNVYIFKVFRSFGWFLPAIILSLLLATGLKAFLLALALPLGQSALSLAFDKLVGQTQKSTKRKRRTKKKPFASPNSSVKMGQDQEVTGRARKGKVGYQSWLAGNAGSVERGTQDAPSFSGWDELDNRRDYNMGSTRKIARTTSGPRRIQMEKDKLTGREKRSNAPLLLRLLIAVFPFLGSWTKLF